MKCQRGNQRPKRGALIAQNLSGDSPGQNQYHDGGPTCQLLEGVSLGVV